jgi:hypothetical protein
LLPILQIIQLKGVKKKFLVRSVEDYKYIRYPSLWKREFGGIFVMRSLSKKSSLSPYASGGTKWGIIGTIIRVRSSVAIR